MESFVWGSVPTSAYGVSSTVPEFATFSEFDRPDQPMCRAEPRYMKPRSKPAKRSTI